MERKYIRGTEEYEDSLQETQARQPQSLGDLLTKNLEAKKKAPLASEDKAKHERAYYVELTRKALGTHWKTGKPYTFGQVNGLTRGWSVAQLRERYFYCEKYGTPFSKVWFGMRKQEIAKAKEQKEAVVV